MVLCSQSVLLPRAQSQLVWRADACAFHTVFCMFDIENMFLNAVLCVFAIGAMQSADADALSSRGTKLQQVVEVEGVCEFSHFCDV